MLRFVSSCASQLGSESEELALRKFQSTVRASWTHGLRLLSKTDFQVLVASEELKVETMEKVQAPFLLC